MNFFSGEFPTMISAMLKVVEHLLLAIGFMFKDNKKYTEDYRLVYWKKCGNFKFTKDHAVKYTEFY